MNRWLAHLLQFVMAFSLLATPTPFASCLTQAAGVQSSDCCCCQSACTCPKDKACVASIPITSDRAVGQVQPTIPARIAIALYTLDRDNNSLLVESAKLGKQEAIPPPLILGSPPQAKLRIWLI